MALSHSETKELVKLIEKLEWPLPKPIFHALLGKIVSVAIELCILDDKQNILTFYRNDHEFVGHHTPGTVIRDSDKSIEEALDRLIRTELKDYKISGPENIGWVHVSKGIGRGKNPTRHEVSLIYLAHVASGCGEGVFSPITRPPKDILSHQKVMLEKVSGYLKERIPLAG